LGWILSCQEKAKYVESTRAEPDISTELWCRSARIVKATATMPRSGLSQLEQYDTCVVARPRLQINARTWPNASQP
jgi:hypothetical protein